MKESIKQWCENNNDYTMLQEWDYSTNEESPESVYRYSAKDINWICKECGKKFIRKPHNIKVLYNCPTCRKKKSSKKRYETLLEQRNSLAADFPQLMEEWDYEHNEVNPNLLLPKSNIRVQWICKNCRNTYAASISHRVNEGTGCPYCSGKKVKYGFNDLESSYPELLKEWDYEKNEVEPKNVFKNSRKDYFWICSICGHKWKASLANRARGTGCPNCVKGLNTSFVEQAIFFYIQKYFCDAINRKVFDLNIEADIYIPSIKVAIEYDGFIFHINKLENDIKKNLYFKKNDIKIIRIRESKRINGEIKSLPTLSKNDINYYTNDYHYKKLSKIIKTILQSLTCKSDFYIDVFLDRFEIQKLAKKVKYEDSLEFLDKDTANLWNYELNKPLTPKDISLKSKLQVNWICPVCGYKWSRSIKNQTKSKGCPNCNKTSLTKEYNLETEYPNVIKTWDYDKNDDEPNSIFPKSHKKYWFRCTKCGKSYSVSIAKRVAGKEFCNDCSRKISDKKRMKEVAQLDKRTLKVINIYNSARDANTQTGVSYKKISACCTGKAKTAGGFVWKFLSDLK